jgi:hypothetical protein
MHISAMGKLAAIDVASRDNISGLAATIGHSCNATGTNVRDI